MFDEEISPEELFRQFFGGGMGGGGFGGGPFGGFGMYKSGSLAISARQLTCAIRRRKRLRLQHGRRTWSQSTPNGRRRSSKKTTQPRQPATSLTDGRTAIPPTAAPPVYHSSSIIALLRRRTNIPQCLLRQSSTAHPSPHLYKTQSRLLRQSQRNHWLHGPKLETPRQPRGKSVHPIPRNTMRVGTHAEAARVPRSARLLEQRSGQVASRGRDDHACVCKAYKHGLPYELALCLGNDGGICLCWLIVARSTLASHMSIFLERADDKFCIAKTYFTFDLILTQPRRHPLKYER